MKTVKSLSELENGLVHKYDFYIIDNGKKYKLDLVELYSMELIHIIKAIREERLSYDHE